MAIKRVPTPRDCGLPEKFDSWRPAQEAALEEMLHSPHRVKAISAPTGFGKSPLYIAYANLTQKPTCVVTDSRGLQDQLMKDYASIGMVDIRGRRNYSCSMRADTTCEEGYALRCPYKGSIACEASLAEIRAAGSRLVVTNYDKWTAARKFGQGMQHFQQVIFDEGHSAPDAVARAMQVILHHKEIEQTLHQPFLTGHWAESMANWKVWAAETKNLAYAEMQKARIDVLVGAPKPSRVRHYMHMRNLVRRLTVLANANAKEWIMDETKEGWQFDPIRPGRYAEAALLLRIPSVVVISATLRPKTLYMLGQRQGEFSFREFDSDFDPRRCPTYYIPTMRVDARAHSLAPLWLRLDQIAARRRDRKGIVHTVSYARRDEILDTSRFAEAMVVNAKGEPPTWMLEEFRHAGPGAILVSPSVGTGYDFPKRECEWQLLCKIPFPDSRNKVTKARQADDPEYGAYRAMQAMVQTFGRGMRSREDQCENFIVDDHVQWFIPRYAHLAPRSFHKFFTRKETLPSPLPPL